jgi:fructose 1,6-bisphosphatase
MIRTIKTPIINIFDGHARIFTRTNAPENEQNLVIAYYNEFHNEHFSNQFIVLLDSENFLMNYSPEAFQQIFRLAGQESEIKIKQNYSNEDNTSEVKRIKLQIDLLQSELNSLLR